MSRPETRRERLTAVQKMLSNQDKTPITLREAENRETAIGYTGCDGPRLAHATNMPRKIPDADSGDGVCPMCTEAKC